jgi:D-alanyl-lipoteichoic acid acyltransferase DltB (MBOAT superfamily)
MLFNSYEFILLFLPITLLGFALLGRTANRNLAVAWLVLASFFFYGWWDARYLLLLGFSTLANYGFGLAIRSARNSGRQATAPWLLGLGLVFNVSLLGYFKYANFFVDTVNVVAGADWYLAAIALPLGISFFTFQKIAYLVDMKRGETEEHNFLQFCLFVFFFPQLIAGPIVHHKEVFPQFNQPSFIKIRLDNLAIGGTLFAMGLFKKVVIADTLALTATPAFSAAEAGEALHFFQAWEGAIAYTLQLYFDFSGYSDMAIGLGRLFGVRLPLNFNSPYQATSIIDFWRRWHMTLSRFLRDYLYIALGGNRKGPRRRYLNLGLTMLLGGLWHGAGWTFLFWGGLHGAYLIVNHAWRNLWRHPIDRWWSRLMARMVTLFFVMIAWVFFRAESFSGALAVFDGMRNLPKTLFERFGPLAEGLLWFGFRFDGPSIGSGNIESMYWLVFWLLLLWTIPNSQQWLARFEPAYSDHHREETEATAPPLLRLLPAFHWKPSTVWAVITGILFATGLLSLSRVSEFLYYQF